ncbi:MAG: DUF58 domain-containing protein [Bacillota bacterium]|nr:DUF58 domain-containing protein [Bacillota bacterium]
MSELFDGEFLNKLQNLVIASKLILSEGSSGNRKSRSKGSSVEFSDFREYAMGDDFRRIDWNAYGRFERLFIKLFMEEREASVNIFLDTSSSMNWGNPDKSMASRRLAAAISYISLSNYDKVSLFCTTSRIEKFKLSMRGKNSFGEVLDFLEKAVYEGTTDLYGAVRDSDIKSGKGISIIISDLFSKSQLPEILNFLQYRKQEVHICHLLSPQEVNPEIDAGLRLVDSETGEYRDVTATPLLIKTYKKVYNRFVSELEELCFKRNVNYLRFETTIPVEEMIKSVVNGG